MPDAVALETDAPLDVPIRAAAPQPIKLLDDALRNLVPCDFQVVSGLQPHPYIWAGAEITSQSQCCVSRDRSLADALHRTEYHIIVFVAHQAVDLSTDADTLVLEDENGDAVVVNVAELSYFMRHSHNLRLVILDTDISGSTKARGSSSIVTTSLRSGQLVDAERDFSRRILGRSLVAGCARCATRSRRH